MKICKTLGILVIMSMLILTGAVSGAMAFRAHKLSYDKTPLFPGRSYGTLIATVNLEYNRIDDTYAEASASIVPKSYEVPANRDASGKYYGMVRIDGHVTITDKRGDYSPYWITYSAPGVIFGRWLVSNSILGHYIPYGGEEYRIYGLGEHKISISASICGPYACAHDDKEITINIVASDREESSTSYVKQTISKSQPVTKPNIQPTPSITTNPAVKTTNPVIAKLFETISNQISSYSNNVETTPSTTPNAQPNPSTTPNKDIQVEPSDIIDAVDETSAVSEEQETSNC